MTPPARDPSRSRQHWLVKAEPAVFSWDDLWSSPSRTTCWDGVRNYQARNFMRDGMRCGDLVLFYHSNAEPPAVVGVAEVAREAYPDPTQFDAADAHFDPRSRRESPTWCMVDLRARVPLARPVPLAELRVTPGLARMTLLQKGNRLSVTPVTPEEFAIVCRLGGASAAG